MLSEGIEERFGTIAIEKGYITIDQLRDALDVQVQEELLGIKHSLIGKILYDLGFLTIDQIQRVLASMRSYGFSMHSQSEG